jgi:acyl carrier protein
MLEKIRKEVLSLLDEGDKSLTDDDALVSSGRLSSFKIVVLATWLEKNYGVDFSARSFNIYDFDTIKKIANLVSHKNDYD